MTRALALLLLLVAGAPGHAYPAAPAPKEPAAPGRLPGGEVDAAVVHTLSFAEDLNQRTDITLQGAHSERTVTLPIPRGWELTADPVVSLDLAHSAALLPERSHVTLLLNGDALTSWRLDQTNTSLARVTAKLPRRLLVDYNQLTLKVVQHYTDGCEDPFDPSLWTRIARTSAVEVTARALPVTDGLEAWPYPLVDRRAFGPLDLTPVLVTAPSAETTVAAGELAFALGRLAEYRPVHVEATVSRVEDAHTAALLVGTTSELPDLRALLGDIPLGETDGLVAILPNPADPTLPVLIVTGGGATGVQRAMQALVGQDRQPVLAGQMALVREAVKDIPADPRAPSWMMPSSGPAPLSTFGYTGDTVRGYFPASIRLPIRLEGDSLIRPGGGTLTLKYAYSAQLDSQLSAMEVRLDGLALRSVPLDNPEGQGNATLKVTLPEDIITPDSHVDVIFHLFPRDYDECDRDSDRQIWGTLFPTSTLDIPRDHVAEMPDLGRLRFGAWPYDTRPMAGRVVVALPDVPSTHAWSAGLELASGLGRLTRATQPAFAFELASATSFSGAKDAHFILLADATRHSLYDSLASSGALDLVEAAPMRSLLGPAKKLLLVAQDGHPLDTIEQILSPANGARSVLVLHEALEGGLARLVATVTETARVSLLEGNAVTVAADGSVRVLRTAEPTRWGTIPMSTEARLEVRRNWPILGVALAACAILVALVMRAWSRAGGGAAQ
ncbi:MAG: cellulose biosynthesis cyclic di-GMP-binding regulatory protein BcsB [Pseudomonadota bacterium]|nr:cellulose biosynthesis cyclic di-GMP-binding regulatory protein BcsB [Pseudomonadota bacterium]